MSLEDRLHPWLSSYVASPQWVKSTIGRAYSLLPRRVKYGRMFPSFQAEVRRSYQLDGLAQAVDAKLMRTLSAALRNVPAYRAFRPLLDEGLSARELLARLPLTCKTDIKAQPQQYLSASAGSDDLLEMFTGGSTANPMRFFSQKNVTRPKESAYFEDLDQRAGLKGGEVILNLRGRTVPGAGEPGQRLWMFEPIKRHLILSSDHLEPRFMPEYVDAIRHWKPGFVHAFPSALYPLARWLDAHPSPEITDLIHGVLLTSENTYDHQLALFKRVFHCPVIRGYGHTERALLAATLPGDDRYFFWPLYGYLELVDARGHAITEPGVLGEIVGTAFDNEVMPFVRYRTGDMGAWSSAPHPGLPGFPVLERIEGRMQDFVVCRDHRVISVTTLGAAHFSDLADFESIQYEQSTPGRLTLRVVSGREIDARQRAAIELAVRQKTQGGCEVDVLRVPRIEPTAAGKQKMMLQHLDVSDYLGASTPAVGLGGGHAAPGQAGGLENLRTVAAPATAASRRTSMPEWRTALLGPAYFQHRRLIESSKTWSEASIESYQHDQVQKLFRRFGDVIRTKQHYRDRLAEYSDWALPGLTQRVTTGGTTGFPFAFYRDLFASRQKERAYIFDVCAEVGYRPFDRRVVYRGNVSSELITYNRFENTYSISPAQLTLDNRKSLVRFLRGLGGFHLHVYPSSLLSLVELLGEDQFRSLGVKGVLASSEAFPADQMQAFEQRFEVPIAYWYGHSEYATLARYCRHCGGFHFYPTYGYTEFLDAGDGLHHIIATSFNRIGTRFIRYDTGDVARLSSRVCTYPFQRVDSIVGRVQDYFIASDGSRRAFGPFLFGIHNQFWSLITSVQFYQKEPGVLGVRIVIRSGASKEQQAWLRDFLIARFELVELKFELVDSIAPTPAGKHRYFINELGA
jgi:phenylacetate-CoA ligase